LEKDRSKYGNFSGCGNTIKANHSIVRRMILDSLRYWASAMHVDGFRFDLASVMSRGEEGEPLSNPPILWSIESDPILAGTKIIAEAWDAAGLYQVGSFVGHRWAEWNGRFRDDMRQFMRGESGCVKRIANRICASPDLYEQPEREPNRSINFITSHDGFTLNDLVSYEKKHNEENGEQNKDGGEYNFSWNCGVEGHSDDPEIEALRLRQIKNFLTILMISQGTPMLLMGDEIRRTQLGNNNAYCQDNELSWFDWSAIEKQGGLFRFVKEIIHFNLSREIFQDARFWTAPNHEPARITFHGIHLGKPDLNEDSHSLAFTLHDHKSSEYLHVMINAYWEPLTFELPALPSRDGKGWHRVIDTALPTPDDFCKPEDAPLVTGSHYKVEPRSIALVLNITID
ncbi:MAG: glycogen debranching enzyme, partial [Chlorobiales bacterium]|nr:glycogen debranching enzyme [Chlorobiales bacterium]